MAPRIQTNERKVKLEGLLVDLEKVEIELALDGASLHKLELQAKSAENVQAKVEKAIEREEAKRARLDDRLSQARAQRRRIQREVRELEQSNRSLYGLGWAVPGGPRQTPTSIGRSTRPNSTNGIVRSVIDRIIGLPEPGNDYDIVWTGSEAPSNIRDIISTRISGDGPSADEGGGEERGGGGDEGGGGGRAVDGEGSGGVSNV